MPTAYSEKSRLKIPKPISKPKSKRRQRPEAAEGRRWTPAEDRAILHEARIGKGLEVAAALVGRSERGTRERLDQLGFRETVPDADFDECLKELRCFTNAGHYANDLVGRLFWRILDHYKQPRDRGHTLMALAGIDPETEGPND